LNAEDRVRAVRFGKMFTKRLLILPARARLSMEAETDPQGHIRETPRFNVSFPAEDDDPEDSSGA
jgi:hypothetical protein